MGRISCICKIFNFFLEKMGGVLNCSMLKISRFAPYFNHTVNMHVVIAAHLVSYRSECRIEVHCALFRNITSNNYSLFYFMYLTTGTLCSLHL